MAAAHHPNARRAEAVGARLPPLLVAAERVASTVAQGVHGRRRVGQGDSFWQFRRFVAGDPIARIDWRQSAKSGRPVPDGWFIRETEWEAAQTVCLWRDASASMRWHSRGVPIEKRERADLLLLALASLLLRGGERVLLMREGARPVSGRGGLDRLAAGPGRQPRPTTPACRRSCPCRAMPAWSCSATSCRRWRRSRRWSAGLAAVPVTGYLLQILDPAETLLPYIGRIRFRGLEREGDTLIPRVETRARRIRPPPEGAAGRPGRHLHRRRVRLRHPPHRPSAGGGVADALRRFGRALARATALQVATMIFAAPWVLLALAGLPLLWWLLRVTPPAPRSETFPAIRLLLGLHATEETPGAHAVVAAGPAPAGRGAGDRRAGAAGAGRRLALRRQRARAAGGGQRLGRRRRLAAAHAGGRTPCWTARRAPGARRPCWPPPPDETGAAPQSHRGDAGRRPARPAGGAASASPGRPTAPPPPTALAGWQQPGSRRGVSGRRPDRRRRFPPLRRGAGRRRPGDGDLLRHRRLPACCCRRTARRTGWSRVWRRRRSRSPPRPSSWRRPATAAPWRAPPSPCRPAPPPAPRGIVLPPELRNRLARLVLEGPPSAGSTVLLDERWRRRPVGLVAGDDATADTPFSGPLFFLRRALAPVHRAARRPTSRRCCSATCRC